MIYKGKNGLLTVSASKLKSFRTCHRQYYYKYVLPKSKRPVDQPGISGIFGTALHKTIEAYYRDNVANPTFYFQEYFFNSITEQEKTGVVKGVEWANKMLAVGKKILREFDWTRFDPMELEYEFLLPYPDKANPVFYVTGYIDMITRDGLIVDHKSQSRVPHQDFLDNDGQFILYAWAYLQIYGKLPKAVIWNQLRTNKLVTVDVLTGFDQKLAYLVDDIMALVHKKDTNIAAYPRRQIDTTCQRECPFYGLCYIAHDSSSEEDD